MRDQHPPRSSISMHDGIAVWCDCCSCEAEPYWQAVAEELGIDLGSDYEADAAPTAQGRGAADEQRGKSAGVAPGRQGASISRRSGK